MLVVDDEKYAADTLAALLSAKGHEVIAVYDGLSAISTGTAGSLDIAVIDIGLGDVDGYEVARALRAHYGPKVCLIAYTGFAGPAVDQRARDSGFDRVVLKPAPLESLLRGLGGGRE